MPRINLHVNPKNAHAEKLLLPLFYKPKTSSCRNRVVLGTCEKRIKTQRPRKASIRNLQPGAGGEVTKKDAFMAGMKINCTREMVGVLAPRAGMGQPAPGGEAGSMKCGDTRALPALGLHSEGSEEGPCPATWRPQVRLLEAEAPDLLPACANPGRTCHPHLCEASPCDVKDQHRN